MGSAHEHYMLMGSAHEHDMLMGLANEHAVTVQIIPYHENGSEMGRK